MRIVSRTIDQLFRAGAAATAPRFIAHAMALRGVIVAPAALSVGLVATAQSLEPPPSVATFAREFAGGMPGELQGGLQRNDAPMDAGALLMVFDAYLEAQHEISRAACAEFAAARIDEHRVWSRAQCFRVTAAEREWRRRSDELIASTIGAWATQENPTAWQRWWTFSQLSTWSRRARMSGDNGPANFIPTESPLRVLECLPSALRDEGSAIIERAADARIAAQKRVVTEHEEARLAMASEAERVGIAGHLREAFVDPPPSPEIERALDPKSFDVDEIRASVDACLVLLVQVRNELLAIMPPEERALRKSALTRELMHVWVLQIEEPDSVNNVSVFALNLLLTRGVPAEHRAEIVKLLGQLRRIEGEYAWTAHNALVVDDPADFFHELRSFTQETRPIFAEIRERIGIEKFNGWILANGLVDDAPSESELASIGFSRPEAVNALMRAKARMELETATNLGAEATAGETALADALISLLHGREIVDDAETERERALLRELLDRLHRRITQEVYPLERLLTDPTGWNPGFRDPNSALEAARDFGAMLESVVPLRDSIESEFVAEVRAVISDDAAAVAEVLLASNAARDACLRLSNAFQSVAHVEVFGGAPLDFELMARSLQDAGARAWLRERLREHGPMLRTRATEFRQHATSLLAAEVGTRVAMAALSPTGSIEEEMSALRRALPNVDDYLRVVEYDNVSMETMKAREHGEADENAPPEDEGRTGGVTIGPAPTVHLSTTVLESLEAWRDSELKALGLLASDGSAAMEDERAARLPEVADAVADGAGVTAEAPSPLAAEAAAEIAAEVALQRCGEGAFGIRETRRMLAVVEGAPADEPSENRLLLERLLRASLARSERALAEARAVFGLPLAAEARVSDESIDAEYSRRMIATQAARFVWQSEQEFARTAFEWLASPSMQARLRDRGR
jgi:hypothetical protein